MERGNQVRHEVRTRWGRTGRDVLIDVGLLADVPIPDRGAFAPIHFVDRGRLRLCESALPPVDYRGGVVYWLLDSETDRIRYIGESHGSPGLRNAHGRARKTITRHVYGYASADPIPGTDGLCRIRAGNAGTYPMGRMHVAWIAVPSGFAFLLQAILIQRAMLDGIQLDNMTGHEADVGHLMDPLALAPLSFGSNID